MKKKLLSAMLSVLLFTSMFIMPVSAVPDEPDDYLSSMSTEDKISQMIMPAFRYYIDEEGNWTNVTEITDDIEAALEKHSFGGVILFGQNTPTNEGTTRLTDAMQKANAKGGDRPQLLITIDQEGGDVTRLGQATVTPGNMALGAANATALTKEAASIICSELSAVGVNADFAPDVDVNNNPANPVIGVRSFSDDPQIVAEQGAAFVQALNEAGVISTLKHFPGHGDTDTDSHTGLPLINKRYDEIKQNELIPFRACIDAGTQMIMTAHIQYPQIETNTYQSKQTGEDIYLPATLSKTIITDILRSDMGYSGVVITDAMEMDAISKHFDKYDAAALAIEAGVDIMLMPVGTVTKADFEELDTYISTLAQMADNGEISMEKINAAVKRILTLKENNGLLTPYNGSDIEIQVDYAINHVGTKETHDKEWEIAKKAITLVKNEDDTLPLNTPNQKTVILVPYDDETIPMNYAVRKLTEDGKLPDGAVVESYSYRHKTLEDMLPLTEDADNVIFLSEIYSASAFQSDIAKMADTICDTMHDKGGKFIIMSVNLPYDVARFQNADAIMLAYLAVSMPVDPEDKTKEIKKYGANMPVALYMMFSKEDAPTAKLPVNIPQLDEEYSYTDTMLYERGFGLTYEVKVDLDEHETVIELNSGAERNGDFVSVNENFVTDNGAYRLTMTGLKENNKNAVLEAFMANFDPQSKKAIKLTDSSFADAEKWDNDPMIFDYEFDAAQCWAASASNMLWISGWTKGLADPKTGLPFESEDDIFAYFTSNFSDSGSDVDRGIDWFFMGEYYVSGASRHASLKEQDDASQGLMKSFVSSLAQKRYDLAVSPQDISELERFDQSCDSPAVFQGSIGPLSEGVLTSSMHSVTLAGVVTDPSAENLKDKYKAVIIIDSDNDAVPDEKATDHDHPSAEQKLLERSQRPNSYTVYNLRYCIDEEGTPYWEIVGYDKDESYALYSVNALSLPDDELIAEYTETEGTKNVFEDVDLTMDIAFTTGNDDPIMMPSTNHIKESTKTVFKAGEPIRIDYFVANRSGIPYDESYEGFCGVTVNWRVVRKSDNAVAAQGADMFDKQLYQRSAVNQLLTLCDENGDLLRLETGDYSVILTLNEDRAVKEAYYKNNTETVLDFTVLTGDKDTSDEQSSEPYDESSDEASDEPTEPSRQPSADTSEQSETTDIPENSIKPGEDTVKTGDTSSTLVILAILTLSLVSVLVLVKGREKMSFDNRS